MTSLSTLRRGARDAVVAALILFLFQPALVEGQVRLRVSGPSTVTANESCFEIPEDGSSIRDTSGVVWTIEADTEHILRNGTWDNVGIVAEVDGALLWFDGEMYALGTTNTWYRFLAPGSWSQASASKPDGGVCDPPLPGCDDFDEEVDPGEDIHAALTAADVSGIVRINTGKHRITSPLVPLTNQKLCAQGGSIISGAILLASGSWGTESGRYVFTGQTQQGTGSPYVPDPGDPSQVPMCRDGFPRCNSNEELYCDQSDGDPRLHHVGSFAALDQPGEWFFDYASDKIFMFDNPASCAGGGPETSKTTYATTGTNTSVELVGLIFERFANPNQDGGLRLGSSWDITDVEVREMHGGCAHGAVAVTWTGGSCHHHGQIGPLGEWDDSVIDGMLIYENNTAGVNPYWEAGGSKFVRSQNLVVRNSYAGYNKGPGFWCDIDCRFVIFEDNHAEWNEFTGFAQEVSFDGTMRRNTSNNNAIGSLVGWVDGGFGVNNTAGTEVYENTSTDDANCITITNFARGTSPIYGIPWTGHNVNVHDNHCWVSGSAGYGRSGWAGPDTPPTGLTWENNHTHYPAGAAAQQWFLTGSVDRTWTQWNALGYDTPGGTFTER